MKEGVILKVDLIPHDKFVEINNLKEVTNPIFFERGNVPTDDGLLSYEIFGRPGSEERKSVFGYIDLKEPFLHPIVYKTLLRLDRKFEELIFGNAKFKLMDTNLNKGTAPVGRKELVKVSDEDEEGQTGILFLYKIWDKINFKRTDSRIRDERVDFIMSLNRDSAFQSKLLVIPAFYRDINYRDVGGKGRVDVDDINEMYSRIMRLVSSIDENKEIAFANIITMNNVQLNLNEIYNYFTNFIKGKNGVFHSAVLGKSVDYGYRAVISAPNYNYESADDMPVDFEHIGVPLSQICVTFFPFIVKWVQDFMTRELAFLKVVEKIGEGKLKTTINPMDDYTLEKIEKKIKAFIKMPIERFEKIKVKTADGYKPYIFAGRMRDPEIKDSNDSDISDRHMTWTDLLYMAAVEVVKDKHVLVSRYPINDYFGLFISKVAVMSTKKTTRKVIEGIEYKHYPVIDLSIDKEEVGNQFIDTLVIFTGYLMIIGGDFDGDQLSVRGIYTQEANAQAEERLYDKNNLLNIMGENIRTVEEEGIQTLFQLTKD